MSSGPHPPIPRDLLMVNTPRRGTPRLYGIITRIIRPLLALIIFAVITVVFIWPWNDDPLTSTNTQISDPAQTSNDLIAPKFSSTDGNGNPFTLTATRAVQVAGKPDLLDLDTPTGTITLSSGITVTGGAPSGLYNQTTNELDLSGGVVFTTSDGYHATVDHLQLNAKTRDIVSDTPIHMTGPLGEMTAQSAKGNTITGIIILTGPATIILNDGI